MAGASLVFRILLQKYNKKTKRRLLPFRFDRIRLYLTVFDSFALTFVLLAQLNAILVTDELYRTRR